MVTVALPPGLRQAERKDAALLGSIIADGFSDDPVNLWLFGRQRPMAPVFRLLAAQAYLPSGFCHIAGDDAATMWCLNSRRRPLGPWADMKLAWILAHQGTRGAISRTLTASRAMSLHHPKEEHLYLFTIAARRQARGRGLGGRLLEPVLAAADAAGLACYLENTNPANTRFYTRHGFRPAGMIELGPGAPPMQAMQREPQAGLA